jgi:hypothetical protein
MLLTSSTSVIPIADLGTPPLDAGRFAAYDNAVASQSTVPLMPLAVAEN